MSLIKPFRYAVVYPDLMRMIDRAWRRQLRTAAMTGSVPPSAETARRTVASTA
jgi:hypothetical protein